MTFPLSQQTFRFVAALFVAIAFQPAESPAVGDAATSFQVLVPPNNDRVGRDSMLIVTNVSPVPAVVSIQDTGEDGDTDDSFAAVSLATGQSQVIYIKDNGVNDDAGGKWDGAYFLITSDRPVVVQIATKSDWQWDFVPADNRTMRGESFFIYSPPTTFSERDVDIVAYEPDTDVSLLKVSTTATNVSGRTSVNLANPATVFTTWLQPGEGSWVMKNLGRDILNPGETYWIRASKPVTVM